jgi:hypothetical protein
MASGNGCLAKVAHWIPQIEIITITAIITIQTILFIGLALKAFSINIFSIHTRILLIQVFAAK